MQIIKLKSREHGGYYKHGSADPFWKALEPRMMNLFEEGTIYRVHNKVENGVRRVMMDLRHRMGLKNRPTL